jgi:hypothetical protein
MRIDNENLRERSTGSGLKGQCHEIFALDFFMNHLSPKPLKITQGSFRIFLRKFAEIFAMKVHHQYQRHWQQILPPVPLVLLILVANLPPMSMILAANFKFATGVNDTGGKFATGAGNHQWPLASHGRIQSASPVLVVLKNMKKINFLKSKLKSRLNKQ